MVSEIEQISLPNVLHVENTLSQTVSLATGREAEWLVVGTPGTRSGSMSGGVQDERQCDGKPGSTAF